MIAEYEDKKVLWNLEDKNGIKEFIPQGGGLYMLGSALFNPHTGEQFFLVKVGKSMKLRSRMESYLTHNPLVFHIGYKVFGEEYYYWENNSIRHINIYKHHLKEAEDKYHEAMKKLGFGHINYSDEWFFTDKETYLKICEKGFEYFD